jgi:hypothetical protein
MVGSQWRVNPVQIGTVNQYFAIVGPRNRNLSEIDRTQDRGFVSADRGGCCEGVHGFQLPLCAKIERHHTPQ